MAQISDTALREAIRLYVEAVPQLVELREKAAEKSKIVSAQKKIFKTYMKQQKLSSLEVGTTTFAMEEEEKVPVSMEKVEKFFPTELVSQYKNENKKRKMTFKEVKD